MILMMARMIILMTIMRKHNSYDDDDDDHDYVDDIDNGKNKYMDIIILRSILR